MKLITPMMRIVCSLCVLLLLSGAARASDTVPEGSGAAPNIAVLDWRGALLGTEMARLEFRAIRESLSEDEREIRQLAEEAQQLQQQLKDQAERLNADEKRQLSKKIQEKAEEYQFLGQRLQKEQRQRQEVYIRSVRPLLDEAIRLVIAARNIDLLMDRQAVTFVHPRLDITQDVIAQLNKLQAQAD